MRDEPPGDRTLNQWQWPLSTGGAWRQGCVRQAVTENYGFCFVSSAWRWECDRGAVFCEESVGLDYEQDWLVGLDHERDSFVEAQ
ncbi:hypothetical protein DEO72_LG6g1489 [Vigna unguiculata]|uniref:Uncharacterized protein n=1 Tax=Vigna unguiculata TaxID=3917 RepID=A0A4D6M5W1_VIGUN|nr:hypothetical protein DEO72_LG6g1489 [Vigna unguiculata]